MTTDRKSDDAISRALSWLIRYDGFVAPLALRLQPQADPETPRMATDGVSLFYNPAWVETAPSAHVAALMGQAAWHCALAHPWRMGERDSDIWHQAATAIVIGNLSQSQHYHLPDDCGRIERLEPMSAEEAYKDLEQTKQKGSGGKGAQNPNGAQSPNSGNAPGQGQGQGQGKGQQQGQGGKDPAQGGADCQLRPPPVATPADRDKLDSDWKVAVLQAAQMAHARGELPASLRELVKDRMRPAVDWREALRRFATTTAKDELSWRRVNRRLLGYGIFLPGQFSEKLPPIAIAIDLSGSTHADRPRFLSEVQAILDELPLEAIHLLHVDAKVHRVDKLESGDDVPSEIEGGGGTDFRPTFKWLEKNPEITALIYLTDLDGSQPETPPDVPVLWVAPLRYVKHAEKTGLIPKFGEVVPMDTESD